MTWRMFYESFGHITALLVGIMTYKRLLKFHKLLLLQILILLPFYISTYLVIRYQKAHHLTLNNLWLLNIYTVVESVCLLCALFSQLTKEAYKPIFHLLVLAFSGLLVYDWCVHSIYEFYTLSFYAQCVLMVLGYSHVLYGIIHRFPDSWATKPETWMIIGLLLYFAGTAPYMALFNQLNQSHSRLLYTLHLIINDMLSNTRYLLLALGFWLAYKQFKFSPNQ